MMTGEQLRDRKFTIERVYDALIDLQYYKGRLNNSMSDTLKESYRKLVIKAIDVLHTNLDYLMQHPELLEVYNHYKL